MKLLFDQNLSPQLPRLLADVYPDSAHILELAMRDATDTEIWEYAKAHGFAIASKGSDFQARSLLYGHPPKFIWLRVGNCPVSTIENLLRKQSVVIHTFGINTTTWPSGGYRLAIAVIQRRRGLYPLSKSVCAGVSSIIYSLMTKISYGVFRHSSPLWRHIARRIGREVAIHIFFTWAYSFARRLSLCSLFP